MPNFLITILFVVVCLHVAQYMYGVLTCTYSKVNKAKITECVIDEKVEGLFVLDYS